MSMSYFSSWLGYAKGFLNWFGLWKINARIILLGLDNAGKTTLLHLLKTGSLKQLPPTRNPTMEEVSIGSLSFKVYDMGGNVRERFLWSDYFPLVSAVVFIVDVADRNRLTEAMDTLKDVLELDHKNLPILILANKIDLPQSMSLEEILEAVSVVRSQFPSSTPNLHIEVASITQKFGIKEGFQWLENVLLHQQLSK